MVRTLGLPRAGVLAVILPLAALAAAPPDPTYKALREAAPGESFVVENIALQRDVATLTLKSGVITFTAPVQGRETSAVFSGEGEITLTPAIGIEKNYLKSLTDSEIFKETFDKAFFSFTDETAKEIRGQAKTKGSDPRAADVLKDFRNRLREEGSHNMDTDVLADLYRAGQPGFFSAYMHGRKRDKLEFHVQPRGVAPSLGPEEVLLYAIQPRGVPDEILYLAHNKSEYAAGTASSNEQKWAVTALSYKIDTSIAGNDRITATAEMKVRALDGGDRVIPLALLPTLRVTKVTADGQEATFIQEDKDHDASLSVVLAQPMEKGSEHTLVLEYAGDKVIFKAGSGNFAVGARVSWYPNVNSFKDHSNFDLTFRVPKKYTLVSIGKPVKEWTEKDVACSQWVTEGPVPVAGFNYGSFKKKQMTEQKTGISIEGYANSEAPDELKAIANSDPRMGGGVNPGAMMDKALSEAAISVQIYNQFFGKSPFSRLALTQQPQDDFGQSWPALVYLPLSAFMDSTQRWSVYGMSQELTQFIAEVTPHEVAHQWWGHTVGTSSYHDVWLSEGFAEFSAGLFLQLTNKTPDKYLDYWDHARQRLLQKNRFGRRANEAGPIWLGIRLDSEKNPGAYDRVVYDKGGYVLHMLRMLMYDPRNGGDKNFVSIMQDFVTSHMNRNASTENFKAVVEKHMTPVMDAAGNGKMDWFFNQWVYGTTVPRYKLDYTVTPGTDPNTFVLKGTVTQSEVPDDFVMPVPLYLDFDTGLVRFGSARLIGNTSLPFETTLPKKPKRVLINAMHDVLEQQ